MKQVAKKIFIFCLALRSFTPIRLRSRRLFESWGTIECSVVLPLIQVSRITQRNTTTRERRKGNANRLCTRSRVSIHTPNCLRAGGQSVGPSNPGITCTCEAPPSGNGSFACLVSETQLLRLLSLATLGRRGRRFMQNLSLFRARQQRDAGSGISRSDMHYSGTPPGPIPRAAR